MKHFDIAGEFIKINLEKTNVLVHCFAGVSRSASIIIAYLMKEKNNTYKEAFSFVKAKRSIIDPNFGF